MRHLPVSLVILSALLALGVACSNGLSDPTPASTAGDVGGIGGGGVSSVSGATAGSTGGTGSTGSTGSNTSSGGTGGTGDANCGAAANPTGVQSALTVNWAFPGNLSCSGLSGTVDHIQVQVFNGATIDSGCDGTLNQSELVGGLPPGDWAVSVRAYNGVSTVLYAGVVSLTMTVGDKLVTVPLNAGDVAATSKICGLPQ